MKITKPPQEGEKKSPNLVEISTCSIMFAELLREGEGGPVEGEGGRGELRQVQVAPTLLPLLRGL